MTVTLDSKPIVVPDGVRKKAGLRRGDQVEFKVAGRSITIVPKQLPSVDYPIETVTRIIKEAKRNPMSGRQGAALDAELMAYGAQQAKKSGLKERDVPRVIHESRARRRTS